MIVAGFALTAILGGCLFAAIWAAYNRLDDHEVKQDEHGEALADLRGDVAALVAYLKVEIQPVDGPMTEPLEVEPATCTCQQCGPTLAPPVLPAHVGFAPDPGPTPFPRGKHRSA